MLQLDQKRYFSVQNVKIVKNKFNRSFRSLHKDFKMATKSQVNVNRGNTMVSIFNKESSLMIILNKFSNTTRRLIDKISPKATVNKHFKIDHNKQFVRNNQKISQLYAQIKKDQKQLKHYSNDKHIKYLYTQQQRRKSDLKRNITFLKRSITSNSKQLLQKSKNNDIHIFDLKTEREKLDRKLQKIQLKNDNVIRKNEFTLKRIKQLQLKMKEYQATGLFVFLNQQDRLISTFNQKLSQLQKLKITTNRQTNRLQHVYYNKLKDLQYQMAGCEAISNKIAQIQLRITKLNNKNEIQLKQYATVPVKSAKILSSL